MGITAWWTEGFVGRGWARPLTGLERVKGCAAIRRARKGSPGWESEEEPGAGPRGSGGEDSYLPWTRRLNSAHYQQTRKRGLRETA